MSQDRQRGGDTRLGPMRVSASFQLRTPIRVAGYLLVGWLGAMAVLWPAAGVFSYLAGLLTPFLFAWVLYGAILAVRPQPRMVRLYLFANLGILIATLLSFAAILILLFTVGQPNTAVSAPIYLAVVLAGLLVGLAIGLRRRPAQAARS